MADAAISDSKSCRKCGISKPVNSENFHRDRTKKDGFSGTCRSCASNQKKAAWANCDKNAAKEKIKRWKAENKLRARLIENRRHEKLMADPERLAKRREWERKYRANSEKRAKWLADRASELAAYSKAWREKNKGRARDLDQKKYERIKADPILWELESERKLKWARDNPEKHKARIARRRARMANVEGTHSADDLCMIIEKQSGKCFYCNGALNPCEFDHFIPISRGGTNWPDNIVAACKPCNASKNNKMPWEWQPHRFCPPS